MDRTRAGDVNLGLMMSSLEVLLAALRVPEMMDDLDFRMGKVSK